MAASQQLRRDWHTSRLFPVKKTINYFQKKKKNEKNVPFPKHVNRTKQITGNNLLCISPSPSHQCPGDALFPFVVCGSLRTSKSEIVVIYYDRDQTCPPKNRGENARARWTVAKMTILKSRVVSRRRRGRFVFIVVYMFTYKYTYTYIHVCLYVILTSIDRSRSKFSQRITRPRWHKKKKSRR